MFLETGLNNSQEIVQFSSSERLSIAATCGIDKISKSFDIDGEVVELDNFNSIKSNIHYLKLNANYIDNVYHLLKKHKEHNTNLKNSFGIHIAYTEGYRVTLAISPMSERIGLTQNMAKAWIREVEQNFVKLMNSIPEVEMKRPSLRKNVLNDTQNMHILPQDQDFFWDILEQAIGHVELHRQIEFVRIATKFGTKYSDALDLKTSFNTKQMKCLSLHCAVELTYENHHIFWAREGLYDIIGDKGKVFPSLSITEAMNFQSSLKTTISADLKNICMFPDQVMFIQMYADTPHMKTDLHPHPISGKF